MEIDLTPQLVLSLFPGADLLGLAFELEGFTVVQGPDVIFGRDIKNFHVPSGRFDGVIGGPPCQAFSPLANIIKAKGQMPKPNLIPEFARILEESDPRWFVMENVTAAPEPRVKTSYSAHSYVVSDVASGGLTSRERRFTVGIKDHFRKARFYVEQLALHEIEPVPAVLASASKMGGKPRLGRARLPGQLPRPTIAQACERQGLPPDWLDDAPLTSAAKYLVIGNGVPLPMGRAVARAVKRALGIGPPRDPQVSLRERCELALQHGWIETTLTAGDAADILDALDRTAARNSGNAVGFGVQGPPQEKPSAT